MSFTCYPIIISRVEGKEFPSAISVMNDILNSGEIPIRLIVDKNNEFFKEIQSQMEDYHIEYIIVVVKYLNQIRT